MLVQSSEQSERPIEVVFQVRPQAKSFGQALRSIPGEIVQMFNIAAPLPPTPVIRPEDVPAAAQPLGKSMSAPYKAQPFISTSARSIWNLRD